MLFNEAISKYERYAKYEVKESTYSRYTTDLRILCLALRNPDIESVTKDQIIEHLELLTAIGWKHNTLYKKMAAYRKFFKFLRIHGYYSIDPAILPKIRVEFVPPRIATEGEYVKLLSVIPKKGFIHLRNEAMARLLWDTGMRNGEMMSLNLKDVSGKPEVYRSRKVYSCVIRTEKSRGVKPVRQIFWTDTTHAVLKVYIKARAEYESHVDFVDPEALFVGATNNGAGKRLSTGAVDILLRKYSKLAKIPTMNAHSFRHARARNIIEKGGVDSDVMNILGHSNINSSRIYTFLYGKDLGRRAEKFL